MNGIPYSLLNLVAMKYVATFRCLDFFMDDTTDPSFSSPLYPVHYAPDKPATLLGREQMVKMKAKTINTIATTTDNKKQEKEHHYNKFNSMGKLSNFKLLKTPPSTKTNYKKYLTTKLVLPELYQELYTEENNYKKSFQDFYKEFQQQKEQQKEQKEQQKEQQYIDI